MEKNKGDDVLKIYTDGATRGNPGHSAYAFVFVKGEKIIYSESQYIGYATNNTVEYVAVIEALKKAAEYANQTVEVYSDSKLVICQVNGEWNINYDHLKRLCQQILMQKSNFKNLLFFHVPRSHPFIIEADRLCNRCLCCHFR